MKEISIVGKSVPVFALVLAGLAVVGTAALLTYYGTITSTVDVHQSILLDGQDVNTGSLTISDGPFHPAPGGEKFCFDHSLTNQMSIDGQVNLVTTCSNDIGNGQDCSGVTTSFLKSADYSLQYSVGDIDVTVEDTGDSIKWTYTGGTQMSVAINYPNGFVIHTSDGNCPTSGWYYSIDGGASCSALPSWVTVTGSEGDSVKTVSIKKSALDDTFKWHGYSVKDGTEVWIGIGPDNGGNWTPKFTAIIWGTLTSPVALQSEQTLPFRSCYDFAIDIWPGIYTITTNVVPG